MPRNNPNAQISGSVGGADFNTFASTYVEKPIETYAQVTGKLEKDYNTALDRYNVINLSMEKIAAGMHEDERHIINDKIAHVKDELSAGIENKQWEKLGTITKGLANEIATDRQLNGALKKNTQFTSWKNGIREQYQNGDIDKEDYEELLENNKYTPIGEADEHGFYDDNFNGREATRYVDIPDYLNKLIPGWRSSIKQLGMKEMKSPNGQIYFVDKQNNKVSYKEVYQSLTQDLENNQEAMDYISNKSRIRSQSMEKIIHNYVYPAAAKASSNQITQTTYNRNHFNDPLNKTPKFTPTPVVEGSVTSLNNPKNREEFFKVNKAVKEQLTQAKENLKNVNPEFESAQSIAKRQRNIDYLQHLADNQDNTLNAFREQSYNSHLKGNIPEDFPNSTDNFNLILDLANDEVVSPEGIIEYAKKFGIDPTLINQYENSLRIDSIGKSEGELKLMGYSYYTNRRRHKLVGHLRAKLVGDDVTNAEQYAPNAGTFGGDTFGDKLMADVDEKIETSGNLTTAPRVMDISGENFTKELNNITNVDNLDFYGMEGIIDEENKPKDFIIEQMTVDEVAGTYMYQGRIPTGKTKEEEKYKKGEDGKDQYYYATISNVKDHNYNIKERALDMYFNSNNPSIIENATKILSPSYSSYKGQIDTKDVGDPNDIPVTGVGNVRVIKTSLAEKGGKDSYRILGTVDKGTNVFVKNEKQNPISIETLIYSLIQMENQSYKTSK